MLRKEEHQIHQHLIQLNMSASFAVNNRVKAYTYLLQILSILKTTRLYISKH